MVEIKNNIRLDNGRFFEINEIYAFISHEDGSEGIIGMLGPDGVMMPFIGADLKRVETLRPLADMVAKARGIKYEVRYFRRVK